MGTRDAPVRFYNFPCPRCGSLVRPYTAGGRVFCPSCRAELTQAVTGMLRVSRMNRVGGGIIGFATCPGCRTLVFARRAASPDSDELWTCAFCGTPVFV